MAIFNEILSARFSRSLYKLFSMKGGSGARQLSSEITPVIQLFYGVETRLLEGWTRFGSLASLAAGGAGNFGAQRLRNPAGSKVMAVIEKAMVFGILADTPRLQLASTAADLGVPGTANRLDGRGGITQPSLISTTSTAGTNLSATIAAAQLSTSNGNYDFITFEEQELTVVPGDAVQLIGNTANQTFQSVFFWRERVLEESEASLL